MSNPPDISSVTRVFAEFYKTVAALRHPQTGCPWDLEQTHETLRKYMIEEAYEAAEVMHPTNYKKLCEELGDVLLQVVLNAQLAQDQRKFSIFDVITSINEKMRRRHPHVFGSDGKGHDTFSRDIQDIHKKWDEIKSSESADTEMPPANTGVFSKIQLHKIVPASLAAVAIGKTAKKIQFDWQDPAQVLAQLESEVAELKHEIQNSGNQTKIAEEMGDVLFTTAQLCRHLQLSPEVCAFEGNQKFLRRFKALESIAAAKGIDVKNAAQAELEDLWKLAKSQEDKA